MSGPAMRTAHHAKKIRTGAAPTHLTATRGVHSASLEVEVLLVHGATPIASAMKAILTTTALQRGGEIQSATTSETGSLQHRGPAMRTGHVSPHLVEGVKGVVMKLVEPKLQPILGKTTNSIVYVNT